MSLCISEAISAGFYSFVFFLGLVKDFSLFNDGLVKKLWAAFLLHILNHYWS